MYVAPKGAYEFGLILAAINIARLTALKQELSTTRP